MQRRGASGKSVKGQSANRPKARKAPTAHLSTDHSPEQFDLIKRERDEGLEQLAATSEVLRVISSTPGDLEPVFQSMLANAVRICEAKFGTMLRAEEGGYRVVAMHGPPPAYAAERRRNPVLRVGPMNPLARVAASKQLQHIADIRTERAYLDRDPAFVGLADDAGARTLLMVPMLKENKLIGAIAIYRQEVRPFTDKQIELVKNFAAQAVIAIENTRLLNELRESLQQQTATADVLKVISSSPGELQPVFETIASRSVALCGATFGIVFRFDGEMISIVAHHNLDQPALEALNRMYPMRADRESQLMGQVIMERSILHIRDVAAEPRYTVAATLALGIRSWLGVPMLRDGNPIGGIALYRRKVELFSDRQIELVKAFAAQTVIAIENARLLNELRQSLEQQTATADVLKIISSSPGDLQPVFNAMLENATRICEAKFGTLYRWEGDALQTVAMHDAPQAFADERRRNPMVRPAPATTLARALATRKPVQDADAPPGALTNLAGARTILSVPMLKENELVGAFSIFRQEVRPFTDKQIELVKNFAAQAVIAIENARLLNDLNKLNQQLEQRVTDQVSEIERMGKLRRFLPPQVADLIVASGTEKQLESHRREITALFCDLRGFTGFSESSDPEDVMALLREYHAAIGGIINKYGGTLERYAGDGVMVVFNDPIPVDRPALQAVLMAIDMRAAIGELIEKWRKLGHEIGFGIGIAHGFATLGTIGFEGRFDYAAIGTVSNVASRLCDEAKPGQILISPRVLMAVEDE